MPRPTQKILLAYYRAMHNRWGNQHWWPAQSRTEIMVGAILTQNTSWRNVEKALANLKSANLLPPNRQPHAESNSIRTLHALGVARLATLIRPAGTYRIKARRLWNLLDWFVTHYDASFARTRRTPTPNLRAALLALHGIGPETADALLLYAFHRPAFVIDTYTLRIFHRHHLLPPAAAYNDAQALAQRLLPADIPLWNDYHAQLVQVGKTFCRTHPHCAGCPLQKFLPQTPS